MLHLSLSLCTGSRWLLTSSSRHWCLPEHSRSPLLAGGIIFPPHPECWIPVNLQTTTENSSLSTLLDFILNSPPPPPQNKKIKRSYSLLIPSLASLYLFEQCLRLGVTSTSSVCLPLQDESLYVFPNCKLLWIKQKKKKCIHLNFIKLTSFVVQGHIYLHFIYSCDDKAGISVLLLQSSVSHDHSEIFLLIWCSRNISDYINVKNNCSA